jgi:hypothetical protein
LPPSLAWHAPMTSLSQAVALGPHLSCPSVPFDPSANLLLPPLLPQFPSCLTVSSGSSLVP